ncbi:hypothetical protein AB0I60_37405 [Actinosynnema sp. NPDC050436]|uniref:hypothetical protein n=1 Tax=Actinosynnema sp. NPDC050436 TaxID=3155659 RepID=UPI0033F253DD
MKGEVDQAAEVLGVLWAALPSGRSEIHRTRLHGVSLELADRFPMAESVSTLLYKATVAYGQMDDFPAATTTASRMVSVWRARCQSGPTDEALCRHAHALDTLASTYRARGMREAVAGCLVELVEWHFTYGNSVGVAWALRELGALAILSGHLEGASTKLIRADELYADCAEDSEIASERAECHVLLGRLARAKGRLHVAEQWFNKALECLKDGAAEEARALRDATRGGQPLPSTSILVVGEFGLPIWGPPRAPSVGLGVRSVG